MRLLEQPKWWAAGTVNGWITDQYLKLGLSGLWVQETDRHGGPFPFPRPSGIRRVGSRGMNARVGELYPKKFKLRELNR